MVLLSVFLVFLDVLSGLVRPTTVALACGRLSSEGHLFNLKAVRLSDVDTSFAVF